MSKTASVVVAHEATFNTVKYIILPDKVFQAVCHDQYPWTSIKLYMDQHTATQTFEDLKTLTRYLQSQGLSIGAELNVICLPA